jgi:hypothetical protein
MPKENPLTGTGVYYPACSRDVLYAYHGILGKVSEEDYNPKYIYEPQEVIATEKAFRKIWQQGALYSNAARLSMGITDQRSMFFGMDRAAGDDEYVFLNICKPHDAGKWGYHLVFDPRKLISEGALVGLDDLQGLYMSAADRIGIEDRNDDTTWTPEEMDAFREDAEFIQDVWRIKGGEAVDWLNWIQGIAVDSPVNKAALRFVDREVGGRHENIIRWLASSPQSAVGYAEMLMPDVVPLDWLVGVVFRKDWIEIDDFVAVYGPPGEPDPPEPPEIWAAQWIMDRRGHPARCMRCGDWIGLAPLEIPEGTSSYHYPRIYRDRMRAEGIDDPIRVMVCQSCGAAFDTGRSFATEGSFRAEKYVAQVGDLEYEPYRW